MAPDHLEGGEVPAPGPGLEPGSSLPDFVHRAIFTVGPWVAGWLLVQLPFLADLIPGDADAETLAAGVAGALVWAATWGWRWWRSWLSRPAAPQALVELAAWTDAMLVLAAAADPDERAADEDRAAGYEPGTADGQAIVDGAAGLYDPTADWTP